MDLDSSQEDTQDEELAQDEGVEDLDTIDESDDSEDDESEDTQDDDIDDSLANDDEDTTEKQAVDYESRFNEELKRRKGSQRSWQQERDARIALERKAKEYEDRLRQFEETQKSATADPWQANSPKNAAFQKTLDKYDLFKEALDKAENKEAVAESWAPLFTEEEKADLARHQQHITQMQRKLATPEGQAEYYRQIAREEVRAEMEQSQSRSQLETYYSELYSQPENKAVLSAPENLAEFRERLQKMGPNPPSDAVELVLENMRYRNASKEIPSVVAKAKAQELAAKEQRRLSKGNAKVDRDSGVTKRQVDPVVKAKRICKERGIEWGSGKSYQILDSVQ